MPVRFSDPLWKGKEEALALLISNKILGATIWSFDDSAICFESEEEAWTAWLSENRQNILRLDRGFVADY